MALDIPTLGLILFLVYLGNGLLAALMAWSGRAFPGAWLWVVAQFLLTLAAGLELVRPLTPDWVSLVVANGLFVAANLPFAHAVWGFRNRRPFPLGLYALMPVVLLSFTLAMDQPFWVRAAVYSTWAALGGGLTGFLLLHRVEDRYRLANIVTAIPFLAVGFVNLLRVFFNLAQPSDPEFAEVTGPNAWFLMGGSLVSTVTLFGYFMMSGIRAEQVLSEKDEEIERRNRQLIESGRSKDLFFSIIAHDLRGPIGGAARYVRKHLMGKMSGLEAKYAEVETLASALEKTNEFLEKLLWWSRAQLEDWVPRRDPIDLAKVLDQVISIHRSAAEMKEIALDVAPGPYPRLAADPESVQIILGNLLSNAIKFTLPGRRVAIWTEEDALTCRITVSDQGVGMDPATIERLFKIEDKLTTHGTTGERGSGLGLLLVRSLAERNQGGVQIESAPGQGTRATLWLPKERREGPK